jgi:hypothetical protein
MWFTTSAEMLVIIKFENYSNVVYFPKPQNPETLNIKKRVSVRPYRKSYGAEARTMTKEEQALLIFERKIFRRIYGSKYENGDWKSRTNRELEDMSEGENIVKWIHGQRISWLGHLERLEEEWMPKKNFIQEMVGTRRRESPGENGKRK